MTISNSPAHRVESDAGDSEINVAESMFGFQFPIDLRDFLQTALPRGPRFPDWRSGDRAALQNWIDLPRRGILFDIESNGFWLEEWGKRPPLLRDSLELAHELITGAPKLIPIYGHRMMPEEPRRRGNPVFSVHQTDIICYGFDLADYFRREFNLAEPESWPDELPRIRFWSTMVG